MGKSFKVFGISDIGLIRSNNEDVWIALPEQGFFAIADGMGGHNAGEVAANTAIETLKNTILSLNTKEPLELIIELRSAIEKANRFVREKGRQNEAHLGMGTTLCCLLWLEQAVIYAHVGDSRIYRYRKDKLELLTEDHSLFAKWLSMGKVAEECQTPYPYKNVITRAVGTKEKANPEIAFSKTEAKDLYLLCTDGLSDVLLLEEMEEILKSSSTLKEASLRLIEQAKFKGSSDNMTAVIVQSQDGDEPDLSRQQLNNSARS